MNIYEKFKLHDGDIVIARTGATTGESLYISRPPEAIFASYLVRLRINSENDPRYIAYWLKSPYFRNYLNGVLGDKSAQPNASASTMTNAPIRLPRLRSDQEAVSSVLASLDDKIELNRRMNETLEAMAQAIFRDWFVDFGPTRRKLAGITDPVEIMGGLVQDASRAAELAKLFPDGLDDSGLPEGWTEKPLGEIVEIVGGSTPSTKVPEYWNDGVHPWATPKDLSNNRTIFLHKTERKITDFGLQCISSGLSPAGSVLLSSRAPIGYLAIADKPTAVNQGFIVMRPSPTFPTEMAYLWCQANMDLIKANANGSTFQEISKGNFRRLVAIYPTPELVSAFVSVAKPLFAMICAREQESETLAATRDLLLPKLMSGEIRLREAEKIAEAAQ
jgi:type I restriction enzyme S subunit